MRRLSKTLDRLADRYDVVVVGSGYGGGIVAARLAAAGHSVCVLERGREMHPGDFPDTLMGAVRQVQMRLHGRRHGARTGLFDLRAGHDLSVLVGCGLGGTSLINAGVALRPPSWVFEDARWPAELRDTGSDVLAPYLGLAEEMLGVARFPSHLERPVKLEALGRAAEALGGHVELPPVAVKFGRRGQPAADAVAPRHDESAQDCQLCGDCVTGCNYGAKNTVATNYLPHAVVHGAHIFTEAEVRTVLPAAEAAGGGWRVSFDSVADSRGRFGDAPSLFVHAETVVLAAGALGSTEILFRSRTEGLAVSPRLGHGFSGNGDALAFAYGADAPVRGLGLGRRPPTPETAVGPCITGMVRIPDGQRGELLVEEGALPGALRSVLPVAFALAAESDEAGGPLSFPRRVWRRLRTSSGALQRTLTYLVMGDDTGEGRLTYDGDGLQVRWPGAGDLPVYDRTDDVVQRASTALGAELVRNPFSTPMFHDSLITVHPLGGCPMGDDATTGVVDHRGRVFAGAGAEVHAGLSVVDGAIVPRPLAVNPLLTISALAERAADLLVTELAEAATEAAAAATAATVEAALAAATSTSHEPGPEAGPGPTPEVAAADATGPVPASDPGERPPPGSWIDALAPFIAPRTGPPHVAPNGSSNGHAGETDRALDAAAPIAASVPAVPPSRDPQPALVGLRFTERMRGHVAPIPSGAVRPAPTDRIDREDLLATCQTGAERGRAEGTTIEFVLSVGVDDLPRMLEDPASPGTLAGTVVAPLLSPHRLQVVGGSFQLVAEDPTHVETWLMRYRMGLVAEDGRRYRFEGTKVLHDRAGLDAWGDTTTLYATIADDTGTPVAAGVMHLGPGDFARQMTTMRVTGVDGRFERLRWIARFDAQFLRALKKVYGGPLDGIGQLPDKRTSPVTLTGDGARKLRLPQPEPRWCDGAGRWHEDNDLGDDAWLRLVRYEGGRRGPVLLAPGFGMSATSFLLSTVEENLTEHLVAKGYDVWLFDYRSGSDLPSARTSFDMDQIATEDWPAAVNEVQRVTGAGNVQVVAHCFGSATLMMALTAGLRDVRSAVCMQVTLHPVTSVFNQVKLSLNLGKALTRMGFGDVAPLRGPSVPNSLLDLALRAVPMPTDERCGKAVCRWVNAIYGPTHRHEQLDDATHELFDHLFGVGDLTALEHIRAIAQARRALDVDGNDVYLTHPERLRLPLLFLHGEHNKIFHPEGSLRTLRWLQAENGPELYDRVVLPGYAHLDALVGRDASRDVFPLISAHLGQFNR